MNRLDLSRLLRILNRHNFALGATDLYTYVLSSNPLPKRRGTSTKSYVLNKISHQGSASHCIFFNHTWEILYHLPCKSMALYNASADGLKEQLSCLRAGERISEYLFH